jgi:hypothetical protein
MAIRDTRLVIKNSDIVNRPFSGATLLAGEAIVNTADGIMMFSGVTTSTSEWTPAGTGGNANFFEVGSNLYDLQLRNRITKYEGATGAGLVGKFLSGTTNGFVLADISSISGVDSFVTGATYNTSTDVLALNLNNGQSTVNVTIPDYYTTGVTFDGSIAYFDRNDTLSAYTLDLSTFVSTADTYTTAFTYDNANELTISRNQGQPDLSVTINEMTGLTVNGTLTAQTLDGGSILSGGTDLLTIINDNDTYVTGGTVSIPATDDTNAATIGLLYANGLTPHTIPFEDTYSTGVTLNGTILEIDRNDGATISVNLSAFTDVDTVITAFTYDNANEFTISDSNGGVFTAIINTVTGMTNTGNLDLQGELANSTGNVVINDNLDITGTTTAWGNILPGEHLTYNLGAQGQRWDNLWVKKVNIGTSTTTLEDDGSNFTMSGNNGNFIFIPSSTGDTVIHSDVLPDADLTRSIGAVGNRWNIVAGDLSATGLTLSNLTAGRVPYVGAGGQLVDEAGFTYNEGTDTLTAVNIDATTDLNVGGDAIIQGSLTVFGPSVSAFTSQLYVEDPNITLNYNPTGNTNATSVNAGWTIQDGDGAGVDTNLEIVRMQNLTGLTASNVE